ncbi:MAG: hypothetical protein HGA36_02920 [Candidatus Moranbacteria bacterium]|nr:hypothetical protein [Candidatus Moranbacteria bacterium]
MQNKILKLFFLLAIFLMLPNFAKALNTAPSIISGTYTSRQDVQLSCSDAVGCAETLYCIGAGCTPNKKYYYAEGVYADAHIYMTGDAVLRYHSRDALGNWEAIKETVYNVNLNESVISFTNGKWETSFACPDWVHLYGQIVLNCDGITQGGNWVSGFEIARNLPTTEAILIDNNWKSEEIKAWANNPAGVADSGAQLHYLYTGKDGTNCDCKEYDCSYPRATNCPNSGGLRIKFSEVLQEYWIRFYQYFPSEMTWGAAFSGGKTLYFDHDYTSGWYFMFPRYPENTGIHFQTNEEGSTTDVGTVVSGNGLAGADWLASSNRQGYGRWIPVELHQKVDTNNANGIVQIWVDNVLVLDRQDFDFGWSEMTNPVEKIEVDGFREILIGSNTNGPEGSPDINIPIRYDDFAIYKTIPPNLDANDNSFIGPIGYGDVTPPGAPSGLSVL